MEIKQDDTVLEIVTGSDYQAAVLCEMGARVYSIERQKSLYEKAKHFLPSLGYMVKMFYGDGYKGLPAFAPFDKIIVTAAAPFIPPKLLEQMRPGGIMVIPLDEDGRQRMLRVTKHGDGTLDEEYFDYFSFVPMLGGKKD